MSHSLDGKVAAVTRGTQGIGLAIAKEFVKQGATVVVTGRDQSRLDEAVAAVGQKASGVRADAGSPTAMDTMLKDVKARYGRLDVVVANAHAPLAKITEEQFDSMIRTNLKGVLFAVQSGCAPHVQRRFDHAHRLDRFRGTAGGDEHLRRHQGRLPRHGPRPHPGSQGHGCLHHILSPGAVDTPSLRRALGKAAGSETVDQIVQSMAQRSPLGRIGEAREIGQVAVFLASDASSYINGIEPFVDGGLTQVA
jgi:NAD(P)-dependent dehydrogenase (short-subunit alcohol dehydrogenase family)